MFIDLLMVDSETLRITIEKLQGFDNPVRGNRLKQAAGEDGNDARALAEATAELNRLFKKFDARQWKIYVNTEHGKVLR
jgi:hypothetical protein